MGVLAAATRLPYVLAFRFRSLANGLQINNFGPANVDLDFVFLPNAVADHFELQLAHPADDGLTVYGFCLNSYGRILLREGAQRPLKVLAVIRRPRTDGHRDNGTALGVRFGHGTALLVTVVSVPPGVSSERRADTCCKQAITLTIKLMSKMAVLDYAPTMGSVDCIPCSKPHYSL